MVSTTREAYRSPEASPAETRTRTYRPVYAVQEIDARDEPLFPLPARRHVDGKLLGITTGPGNTGDVKREDPQSHGRSGPDLCRFGGIVGVASIERCQLSVRPAQTGPHRVPALRWNLPGSGRPRVLLGRSRFDGCANPADRVGNLESQGPGFPCRLNTGCTWSPSW